MDIATEIPLASFDGRFVVIQIQSGSKLIELALDAHQSARLAGQLKFAAQDAFDKQRESNVIQFRKLSNAD
ncbi:hypothetical protein K3152_13520 [Qipengyuania sp. 1NDH17]|uniref:DUF1488 family protein n=1 Tax=Qipengyuania polymorpha TaxID=2867234 RepID=A0ABS7J3B9_9SPHN|nr:hypothetical protein [Qipengyuania polymorpha]MBX7459267.1 hypothetical protein [Qipengyuania polymorpha]